MARNDWRARLKALDPCPEAYQWAVKHRTLREAWRMCEDFDWMRWLLLECGDNYAYDVVDAIDETTGDPWESPSSYSEVALQDAYICLDFMPDPPTLPPCPE